MLSLKKAYKEYVSKTNDKVIALNNLTIEFPDQGMVFIVGKSGCGKTTLLNVLGKNDKLTSGSCSYNNIDIEKIDDYHSNVVGFVFQNYNLLSNFSVEENIKMPFYLRNEKVDEKTFSSLVKKLDIEELLKRNIDELSGGQQQRVAIARTLLASPKIILADEPTGALDSENSKMLYKLLKEISKDCLVIVVSHDTEAANLYSDYLIKMSDGNIDSNFEIKNLDEKPIDIKPKKTLNLVNAFKMSRRLFSKKKVNLCFSLIFLIISILIFSLSLSLFSFNVYNAVDKTMDYYDENTFVFTRKLKYSSITPLFTNELLESIDGDIQDNGLNGYLPYNLSTKELISFEQNYDKAYATINIFHDPMTAFEWDSKLIDEFGLNIICGNFPTNDNEIMISYNLFEAFKLRDYKNELVSKKINEENDLIGLEVDGFTISGIYSNPRNYRGELTLAKDLYDKQFCFQNSIILNTGFYMNNEYATNIKIAKNYLNRDQISFVDDFNNGCILSYDYILKNLGKIDYETEILNKKMKYYDLSADEATQKAIDDVMKIINDYLASNDTIDVGYFTPYCSYANNGMSFDEKNELETVKILGAYQNTSKQDLIRFSSNYQKFADDYSFVKEKIIFKDKLNGKKMLYKAINDENFITQSYIYDAIKNVERDFTMFKFIFMGSSILFLAIAAVMVIRFVNINVKENERNIGILRTLGAKNKDFNVIFVSYNTIITLIAVVISAILYIPSTTLCNNLFVYDGLYMKLVFPTAYAFISMLVIGVIFPIIATIIPVKFKMKNTISTNIKNIE